VRLDRANRSFLIVVAVSLSLGALLLCGALGGVLVPLALARAAQGRLFDLSHDGLSLLPVVLFGVLVAIGIVRGCWSFILQAVASRRLAHRVHALAIAIPAELASSVAKTELDGRVILVEATDPFSFVYGVLTPRVAVSQGLLEGASPGELRAVLVHEHYHVRNLDPLKVMLVRALSSALFFLPALESLRARYTADRELAADRWAVAACGRRSLAGALLRVVRGPDWNELSAGTAIGGDELLDVRIAQLESGEEPRAEALSARPVVLSLLGAAVLLATFVVSVSTFGGPAAVHRATGADLASATLVGSLACAAPFAVAGLFAYAFVAFRARRPLQAAHSASSSTTAWIEAL
jgi:beta-lactamase regulating signal transducer with metallopeptidase domain